LTHFAELVLNGGKAAIHRTMQYQAEKGRTAMASVQSPVTEEEIAQRAYEIWQARGCPASDGSEDWKAAEAELTAERIGRNGSTQHRLRSWWGRVRHKMAGDE
jgi:hypothetical protein